MKKIIAFGGWIVPVIIAIVALWPQLNDFLKKKSLSYTVIESSKLLQNKGSIESQAKIIIGENTFTNPYVSYLEIENTGDIPIKKDDFEKPIFITTSSTNLLLYNVVDKFPNNLDVKLDNKDDTLVIEPLLLNAGDKIKIQFVSDEKPVFDVFTRIIGIREVKKLFVKIKPFPLEQIFNAVIFSIVFYLFILKDFKSSIKNSGMYEECLYMALSFIFIAFPVLYIFSKQFRDNIHWSYPILTLPGLIIWIKLLLKKNSSKSTNEDSVVENN